MASQLTFGNALTSRELSDDPDAIIVDDRDREPYATLLSGARIKMRSSFNRAEHVAMTLAVENENLTEENVALRDKMRKMNNVIAQSKFETAEMCEKFGELAKSWKDMVKQMKIEHEEDRKGYEKRIEALEKTNEKLLKENEKMRKTIMEFEEKQAELLKMNERLMEDNEKTKKVIAEFEKDKRKLKLGQIAYKLELLVSEYVFPGSDKDEKVRRARYNVKLKSLKGKVHGLEANELRQVAETRLSSLDDEMFEKWFLDMVGDLKKRRIDTAHPELGSYEEMEAIIKTEFHENGECEDILKALEHLRTMYQKLERPFGV